MSCEVLVQTIEKETESINKLLDCISRQKDAVRDGNFGEMQDIMKLLHSASLEVQKFEALRDKAASALAADFNCEKTLSSLCGALGADGAEKILRSAGEKLDKAVRSIQSESQILKRLIEEGQKYNDMMLSEIRRFEGRYFTGDNSSMDIKV